MSNTLRARFGAIVAAGLFGGSVAAFSGCATLRGQDAVSTEQLLVKAGFQMRNAKSPEQARNLASWDQWFHVSWAPEPDGKTPTPRIEASIRNDLPYRVTDVQLEVEGLSADQHSVGRRVVWALRDIVSAEPTH
jgi:hypothetical protein